MYNGSLISCWSLMQYHKQEEIIPSIKEILIWCLNLPLTTPLLFHLALYKRNKSKELSMSTWPLGAPPTPPHHPRWRCWKGGAHAAHSHAYAHCPPALLQTLSNVPSHCIFAHLSKSWGHGLQELPLKVK